LRVFPKRFRHTAVAACLALAPFVTAAAVPAELQSLIQQGEYEKALRQLDVLVSDNPQDAEARFTRGLVMVQLNRTDAAIRVFADLTRDYPQLPEPYNNLAVLYAQKGDYEQARAALEAALATHPSYATAHENLGDIYAALAGAAYNRALLLDQNNQGVRNKLSLISQLDGRSPPARPVPAVPPPSAPPVAAEAPPPSFTPTPAAAAPASPAVDGVDTLVDAWAQAWASQDLEGYFNAYASNFEPEGGLTREAWQAQRRERISRPGDISVGVRDLRSEPTDSGARATFVQAYQSDNFSDVVTKVLDLVREGGGWKIAREYTR
jgi:hypothetical protein